MARSLQALSGVFLGSHAVADGLVTRTQLQSGLYRRLFQDVYADPHLAVDHRLYARGAMLVMPPAAVLAGRSAAAWFDAPFAGSTDPVLVVVPPDCPWRGPRGIRVHRTDIGPAEVLTLDDSDDLVRLTTPLRTAWEIATLEPLAPAVALLDAMIRAGHVDDGSLARIARDRRGQWGSRRFARVVPLADGRSESRPESLVRVACVRAGLPAPVPQFVVTANGQFLGRVDLAWPEARLIVEYEGAHHFDELHIRRDDRRYERLVAAGWRVIRLSWADLRDLADAVSRIARALGLPLTAG
ncbi:endonuclease domain-containing protein [Blastococcus deserti]|uniref:Endonuclease domain-containing protein n=1 Tax=Blastococcus deserti TaxID=2259033 RepID=A0ABW4XBS4_9ACTN